MVSSNVAKGNKAENEVCNIFKSWGLIVNKAQRTMKPIFNKKGKIVRFISQANDLWGLYDGMAKDPHRTYYFQVKSRLTHVSECKPKIEKFDDEYLEINEISQIWLRVKRKGFVVFEWDGFKWEKDFYNLKGEQVEKFKYS